MVKPQFLTTIHRIKTSLSWFLLLCLITADLYAIPSFTENVVSTAADGVWGVYVADVDGDGDLDIIRASLYDNTVAWYENTGTGYIGHVITTEANGAIEVYAADIDSDGDMDVLSANYYEAKIAWYENNGSQSFTAHTISTSMSYAYDVYAADVDSDGDIDVLGAAYDSDQIAWFENDGNQSFTSHTVTTVADGAASVYAEDVDNDGDLDILSASINDDEIAWYENNGSQSFTAHTISTAANGANTVYAIDIDNDGDIDVLSASQVDDKIAWYENNGSQSFTSRTISTTADGAFDLYALDFDQDGDVDVLSASIYDNEITFYENNGSQSFTAYVITSNVSGTRSVFADDMDGDGDNDIIVTALNDDKVAVYINESSGLSTPSFAANTISTSADGAVSVFAADMDADGDMDIVSGSYNDDAISWYENDGAANPSWTAADIATSADGVQSVFVADLDGDGDMDIISGSYNDDAISWYENDGAADPSWTAADIATSADGATSVFAADMDDDGDMDILSASENDDKIAWYQNSAGRNAPLVTSVTSTKGNGSYGVGTNISIIVNFSDQVLVTGTPQLTLETGTTDAVINYSSGSGTGHLVFDYTVAAGESSGDLDYQSASALTLNGGTIKDARGNNNDASLSLPVPGTTNSLSANKDLVIETIAPTVTNVSSTTADGTYGTGDTLDVTITFSEIVNVTTGTIGCGDFLISSLPFTAQYSNAGQTNNWDVSGSDGSDIAYTLNLGQATTISVTTCAAYSDYDTKLEIFTATGECVATTTSYFNDDYSCSYSGLRSTLPSCVLASGKYYIVVDGYAGATGNYQVDIAEVSGRNENGNNNADGDLPGIFDRPNFTSTAGYDDDYEINKLRADGFTPLEIQQLLNETADDPSSASRTGGTGTPRITMETGAADSAAYYVSGTGTATISFQYVILSGDSTSDLDYVSTTALEANSGTIRDAAGNDATLTLPTPGSTGSLAANKALIIDGIGPLVSSVSSTAPDSTYDVGSMLPITITFNEIVVVTGTPQLTLETGASDAVVDYVSGSGTTTLTFNYTSTTGENSSDLDYQDTTALVLNGGSITDSFGNVANLILPLPGSAGSLGANKAIIIDGGAPIVYTITSTAADGTYNLGDIIPITITFSDAITVTGVPHLEINTGGTSLSFDGNGDYVRMAGFNPSTTDFALSLWVKSHAASNYNKNIFHQMDGSGTGRNILGIKYSGNDEFFTFLGGGNRYSGFVPEINRWYNVVLVHNNSGNTLTWYINGVEKNTNSANVESTVGDFLIGVHKNFGSNTYFNGLVDEVSIWNNTLDSSEIIGLYNNGISISAAANSGDYTSADHLIRYYTMDEGYGSAIIDRSTSNIDGTIYNATWGPSPLRGDTVSYSSGSGASALIFNYTVANGQQTADLDYTRTDALFLNGGTIKEPSGNDAILSLPLPGTTGSLGVDKDIVVDGKVPAVTAVTSPTVDGSYSLGESIAITITLDEVVTVTGTPQLTLETGTSDATVNYASGSGTSLLTFNYTVAEGDTNSDLAYQGTNALALNSGTIRDAAGNDASLTLPTPGATGSLSAVKALVIDGVVPTITNVTSNAADSTYNVGDTLDIIVQFSETMTVGTASLGCGDFLISSLPFTAQYSNAGQTNNWDVSGSDGSDIAYTLNLVQATTISVTTCAAYSDYDTKLEIFTATGECVATTTSYFNDDYSCTYSGLRSTLPSCVLAAGTYYIIVDGYAGATGNYQVDIAEVSGRVTTDAETGNYDQQYEMDKLIADGYQEWEIRDIIAAHDVDEPFYTFSRTGSGTPQLTLETGTSDANASYISGDGTTDLSFRYIVEMGQNSSDLDYDSINALDLNSGVISDPAGNNATLTLPTPGAAGSLGANKDIVINGGVPVISSVTSSIANGNYITGDVIPINVVFSENVTVTDTPQIQLSTGGYAMDLDGNDDYAFVPNHSSLQFGTGDFSVSVWFKIDAIGATRQIFCKRGGSGNYEVQVNSAGKLSAWAPGGFSGSTVLSANTWYNVTLTRVSSYTYMYLNGALEASAGNSGTQNSSNGLSIGRDSYGGERFNGNIDELAIWNSGLSAAEALANYNGNATIDLTGDSGDYASSSNLVLYLRMNEGIGTAAIDATGNGHNAALNNGATWVESQLGGTDVNYTSGSGTDTLTFNYTILNGNFSSDLDYTDTTALSLNGGTIKDGGGNNAILTLPVPGSTGSLSANKDLVVDGNVPTITNVTSTNADGTYSSGDSISISITYSEAVTVTGTPQLTLETGTTDASANYSSGSGASVLTFLYIVAGGDSSADLDYASTSALTLNDGTITDSGTNNAALALPEPGSLGSLGANRALVIEGILPAITAVTSTSSNGTYKVGDVIPVTATFTEAVTVTGNPFVLLNSSTDTTSGYNLGFDGTDDYLDVGTVNTDFSGGMTVSSWVFYNSFNNWSRIFDFGEGQANDNILLANYGTTNNLTFEVYVGGTSGGKVTANGILETGVWMHLVAVMDVGGNVVLYKNGAQIQTGTTGVPAAVNRTSSFIGKSNWSWDGYFNGLMDDIAIWNSALTAVNVNALYNSGIGLDASSNLGNYTASESLVGYWAMNEGTGTIVADGSVNSNTGTLTNGTFWDTGPRTGNYAGYVSGSGSSTLTFNYRVANGNSSSDLDYRDTTAMILNSGTITDASGNNADLILPVPGNAGSLGANKALVIDGVIPTVSSVTSVAADTAYGAGDTLLLTLNFNKAVTVTGTPQLALETGTTDAVISYASGSGTNALNFQYIVATGDTSSDLDYTGTTALALGDGSIVDAVGNTANLILPAVGAAGSLSASKTLVIDGVMPAISTVSSNAADSTYIIGDTLLIVATFSEAVLVSGTPQLTLETGAADAVADYSTGGGTTLLSFQYIVAPGDISADLDYTITTALALNSGTITDAAGNVADLTLQTPGSTGSLGASKALVIDGIAPIVYTVSSSSTDGIYNIGDTLAIAITFSDTVTVTGTPQLTLETGSSDALAAYHIGSGTTTLNFRYIVANGHIASDLDYDSTASLALNGGTINDRSGNAATLTLPVPGSSGSLGAEKALVIDGIAPIVSAVSSSATDGTYSIGDTLDISVTFSEEVSVSGTPQLTLETGTTDAVVDYTSGSGTSTLTFKFTIARGNTSSDLDYTDTTALALNGGSIMDAAGNSANVILPLPDSTGSLGYTKALVVDGGAPLVSSVSSTAVDSSYIIGDTLAITMVFTEAVAVTGTPKLTLETGTSDAVIYYAAGSGTSTLSFEYVVASGHASSDLNYADTTSLTLNGGSVRDAAGNDASLTLPDPDSTGALGVNKALVIDGIVPTVNSVTSAIADGLFKLGDTLAITITFSEAITVTGTPQLTLETGNNDAVVDYSSGSGTSILTFQYLVTAGDSTSDLDYVGAIALGLNSGSIRDTAGNNATLILPEPGASYSLGYNKALVIDGLVPTIFSVTSPAADTVYKIDDLIAVIITLSEAVVVDTTGGKPQIILETGATNAIADYSSGSGSATLTFNYTVASGNSSNDLDYTSDSALTLNGGTIVDAAGSSADLTLAAPGAAGSLAANKALFIDGVSPVVISVSSNAIDTTYSIADTIGIAVTFSEAVTVTGTPQLTMETGDSDATVNYTAGTGTNVLTFNYIVANGHSSIDLDYVSTSALALNSGTITDAVGNAATLTLPAPGSAGSLSNNKTIVLDAEPPTVTQMLSTNSNGSYKMGDTLTIAILFNEKVLVTGTPQLTLETGTNDALADYLSGNDTTMISFRYVVAAGHVNPDLAYVSTTALALNNGTIMDAAGNNATLTLPAPGASFSLSSNMNLNVEGVLPAVPAGLITTPDSAQIQLDWTPNADADLASYKVYGGTSSNPATLLATITTGTETYTQTDLTNGTIYYYRISAVDNVGNKSAETSDVAALAHELSVTSSLDFDGTDDYAGGNASTDFDIVDEFTVSAWIKADEIKNASIIDRLPYSGSNGYRLNTRENGEIWATFGTGETNVVANTSSNYYSTGVNYLVTGVYKDGYYVKLYVNGNLMETVTTEISFSTDKSLEFGRWYNTVGDNEYFNGLIDEIGIWNKALSASELLTMYTEVSNTDLRTNSGDYVSAANLKAYWRFSESTGFTLYDISGKGHHISFTGAVWNTDVIDVTGPTLTAVSAAVDDGLFGIGDTIVVNVSFNEAVTVTGTPQLTLETGTTDAVLDYASGTGSATLNFSYIISNGESSADLDYVGTTSLVLNGGTIKDVATNNADLTLPEPDSTGSLAATKNIIIDGNPPTVTAVSSSTQDGTYNIGDLVAITVTFNENVMVTGSPQLTLETGATDAIASYTSGTGTTTLTFNYTVGLGHENSDLEYNSTNALALNSGTIVDAAGNNVTLTLPEIGGTGSLANNKALMIDGVVPTVNSVSVNTVDGYYKAGDTLGLTITFSEIVAVTGVPQLVLETGSNDAVIYYNSGSGTVTLNFNYIVESGHSNSDLDYVSTSSLSLNNGLIRDAAGNDATLTLLEPGSSGSLSANKALVVDAIIPTVSSVSSTTPDSIYNIGDTLVITVNFPETVVVDTSTGKPQLTLETGAVNAVVDYTSGSGSTALSFQYIIVQDHTSEDLDYIGTDALSLNGGTIRDLANNYATLTLPAPGASESLSANKALVVDGVIPTIISSISSTLSDGTYKIGDTLGIAINFSELVYVTGTPQLTMETGDPDGVADYASGSATSTLIFNYIVIGGHNSTDLDYASDSALALNIGTIIDPSGNNANLTLPIPGSPTSFSANKAIIVDGIVPTVDNVSSPDNDGMLIFGSTAGITITFSEVVAVTGTPQLTIETGTNDAVLDYTSGSGSATLTFNYTVAAGHTSSDLDYTSSSALALNGGIIRDGAGNDATIALPAPAGTGSLAANKALVVDGVAPLLTSVTSAVADGNYMIGDTIPVSIVFDDTVYSIGTPQISLVTSSSGNTLVNYSTGSGSPVLIFDYVVEGGHESNDLDYTNTSALTLNGGTIKDFSGNNATLTLILPGNTGSLGNNKDLVVDGIIAAVSGVTSAEIDGYYNIGDTLDITVSLTETVNVTGTPQLDLETGSVDHSANYISGSGSEIITFQYIVQAGDASSDLDYLSNTALDLNGGTINDVAGNSAEVSLAAPGAAGSLSSIKSLIIDGGAPVVTMVSSQTSDGTYIIGDTLNINITFNENIYVSGSPQLTLETGSNDATSSFVSGDSSTIISFRYIVENGHNSGDLDYTSTSSLALNSGTLQDIAGNDVSLSLPIPGQSSSLSANKALIIDGLQPTVANVSSSLNDGLYNIGDNIPLTVTFSENVLVTGTPQLTVATGDSNTVVDYASGSGTNTLTFNYVVANGDYATDLDYLGTNALALNSGVIQDVAGNDATVTLVAAGAEGSLGANKDIVVDGIVPTVSNVSTANADGLYMIGDSIVITVTFTEAVGVTGTPQVNLSTGSANTLINYVLGSGTTTLSFDYVVESGDSVGDLGYADTSALILNGGSIKDVAGNDATLDFTTPGADGSLAANKTLVIDGVLAVVNAVSSSSSDGTYKIGDTLNIAITFNESVFTTGVPQLTLETGDADAVVDYSIGSGSTTLNFSYIVFEGQSTNDLDYTTTNSLVLNGGKIKDAAGNDVILTLPEPASTYSLSDSVDLNIDGILPFIYSATSPTADGTYLVGDTIDISFTFSEEVNVSGTPQLTLETGNTDAVIEYLSGNGSTELIFRFIVESGHNSTDLGYASDSALVLNGGTITDVAGNGSLLNLPEPGSTFSISGSKEIYVDGDIPESPTGLIATPGLGKIDLSWQPNTENDLAHYRIFADTTSNPSVLITTVAVGTEKYSDVGITDGVVRYYRISAVDLAGNESQNTSTAFAMSHDPGNVQCLSFDGGDDYIQTPLGGNMLPLTISVLFKPDVNSGEQSIVDSDVSGSYGQSLILGYGDGDNTVDVQYHNGYYDSPFTYSTDKWYHAVAVYDSGSVSLYMNAELVGTETFTQAAPDGSNFRIGRHNSGDPQWYDGKIDEVIIWNDALSLSEIQAIKSNPLDIDLNADTDNYLSSSDVIGYWKFGESFGSVVYDISGNGNHGTINGASWDSEGVDMVPPAMPESLSATAGNRQITLFWNQNTETDLYQYLVYGGTDPFPATIVATNSSISDTTVIISNLENGTTYYYRLSAIDYAGMESEKTLDVYSMPTPQKYEVGPSGTGDFTSIQSAINFAADDDTLIVYSSTYYENIDLLGKALIIGSEYLTSGDTAHITSTVIDGQLNGSTLTITDVSGTEVRLVGFTIQNGSSSDGGAIYSSNSSPVLENLIVTSSAATNNGGGIYLNGGNPSLSNITIVNNIAANKGGGIYLQNNSSATLNKLTIVNNSAINGGGISLNSSNPTITNMVISDNSADSTGGAVAMYSNSNPGVYNAVIYDNYAGLFGGAMQISRSNPMIVNSTIIANHGEFHGGALHLTDESEVVVTNSILYENIPEQFFINDPEDSLTVSFSDVEGNFDEVDYSHESESVSTSLVTWAQSNIDVNPLFSDASNDEYSLSDYSMAIGVGSSVNSFNSDINGWNRPSPTGSDPDMGAYENLRSIPDVWLTLVNDQFFINEDSTLLFNPVLNDSIVNIHLVDLAIVDSANHGILQIASDSTISYQPDQNYFGKDTILYAFDNAERRDSALTIITIYMLEDDPPVITSSATSFAVEDETYNYLYDGYDPDIGTNRWEIENVPTWLSMENDSIIGIPLEGDLDTSFLLIYSDSYFSDTLEIGIFVTPVNDPPEIKSADSILVDESEYYVYHASAEDPEDSILTWIFSDLPTWMSTAGDSSFGTPIEGAPDTSFRIMVSDGEYWDSTLIFVDVIPYDDLPVITSSDSLLAIEDEFVTFNFAGYDPEGLPILWSVNHLPSWLSMEGDDVSGIPREGDFDTLFTLFASDGTLNDSLVIGVYVTPVNDVPMITSHNIDTAYVDEYFVYYPLATDPEDSTLTWVFSDLPTWMSTTGDSLYGLVARGSDDTLFTVVVSDGELADTLDVMLEVIDINYPPEIAFMQLVGEYHDDIELSFNLYDFDDDDLDYDISFTTDGITWNNAIVSEQSGIAGQDTMTVIWHSMSDLDGIYNSNVQVKIFAYDLDTDTLQTPDDTSSILISDLFAVDNHIGSLSVSMAETMDEYFGDIELTYAIEDTTEDLYAINMNYSLDNGNSWHPATLQDNLTGLSVVDYLDSLTWISDDDLFNTDTNILLEVSISDGWQYTASSQIAIHFDNQVLPLLTTVQPDTGQYMYWYDQITLTFTGQMDLESYSDGVILESDQRGVLEYDAEFIQGNEVAQLIITPVENYYADEQIQISINQQLHDVWNNSFDGNGNGDPDGEVDDDTILFTINLLGDYDRSSLVDFEDLVALQQNWWDETVTPADEIGPATGTPPFMQIQPDSKMDFEDLMIFVQMWNWSTGFDYDGGRIARSSQTEENYAKISASYPPPQVGDDVEELYLYVDFDSIQAVGALGLEISYDPEVIEYVDQSSRFDQYWTELSYHDSANHRIVIQLADLDQEIRIQPMNKQVKLKFHRLVDTETEVIWGIDLRDRAGRIREVFTQSYKFSTTAPLPEQYALHQNYPNPFNSSTTIRYDLPEDSHIHIAIYNILGQEVRVLVDGFEPAGFRSIRWHGKDNFNRNVSAGVYFLLMESKDFTLTRKLILLK